MSKILNLICIPIITIALYACSDPSQPEILEGKDLETAQAPYFVKEFLLIKHGKHCLLKTKSVLPNSVEINKTWGNLNGKLSLLLDDSNNSDSTISATTSETDKMYEEHLLTIKRNKENPLCI